MERAIKHTLLLKKNVGQPQTDYYYSILSFSKELGERCRYALFKYIQQPSIIVLIIQMVTVFLKRTHLISVGLHPFGIIIPNEEE